MCVCLYCVCVCVCVCGGEGGGGGGGGGNSLHGEKVDSPTLHVLGPGYKCMLYIGHFLFCIMSTQHTF